MTVERPESFFSGSGAVLPYNREDIIEEEIR